MPTFTSLFVWQRAYQLSLSVYHATRGFPREELYGLTSQLRRAAVSIGANIAEGQKRKSPREFSNFLSIAEGSLAETQHFLMLARDLGYLPSEQCQPLDELASEVERMLVVLQRRIREKCQPAEE